MNIMDAIRSNNNIIKIVFNRIHQMLVSEFYTLGDFLILYSLIFTGISALLIISALVCSWF